MLRRRPLNQSLANRYTLLTMTLVVFTSLLMALTSASGVYRMALREESARQRAQREFVMSEVTGRLQTSGRIVRSLGQRDALNADDEVVARRALASSFAANDEYLRGMVLVRADGEIVSEYPAGSAGNQGELRMLAEQASPVQAYRWITAADGHGGSLWAVVSIQGADGEATVLLGKVRTAFIDVALRRLTLSDEQPTVFFTDGDGEVIFSAGDPDAYRTGRVTYVSAPDSKTLGTAEIGIGDSVSFQGVYGDLTGFPGLKWRCVVVGPAHSVASETWKALAPAVIVWGVVAVFAAALVIVGVWFLVRPLRLLDAQARAAASGALLEPLEVRRRDEIGRLIESFNAVAERLRGMHDISQLLARSVDRDEVLDGIVSALSHMLGVGNVDVFLSEDVPSRLRLARTIGNLSGKEGLTVDVDASAWLTRTLETRGVEVFVGDPQADPIMALHDAGGEGLMGVATSFVKGSEVLGVVVAVCDAKRILSDAEADIMRSFAAQAAVALDNARLFADEHRSRREAEVLRTTAEVLAGYEDLRAALQRVAAVEAEALGMSVSFVALSDAASLRAAPSKNAIVEAALLEYWRGRPSGSFDAATVAIDVSREAELIPIGDALGVQSLLVTPLYRAGMLAGLIVLGDGGPPLALSRDGEAIVETIGKQVVLALDVAYLFDQARSRADNLETIFRISQAVSSSLQSKVVLNRVLDVVQKIFSADAVMLMTYERDRKIMIVPMARGLVHPEMLEMTFAPGTDIPGRVYLTKEPERFPILDNVDSHLIRAAARQGLGSGIFIPLLARGRSIGVLALFSRNTDAFSEEDGELLRTFGSQAALAIDTANLFSREHHVATVLQESILPTRLPQVAGIDASSVYVPAGSELEIGGDYYDVFYAPGGRLVLAIGDVCGKGVEAATKTSMIKYLVRGMIAAGANPGSVLLELNRTLVESGDPSDIVTLWLGMLDVADGELVWANGGHPPAMLLTPSGDVIRLGTTGALLGAVATADFGESRVAMEAGATLLLYTDGVTEARTKGRFFGEGRVRRALRQGGSATAVAQRLLAAVQRFSAGELRDDAAILVIRRPVLAGGTQESVSAE